MTHPRRVKVKIKNTPLKGGIIFYFNFPAGATPNPFECND